eukprot:c12522_g1_i1.p1 GENE.c12522_g1_i1~~c12522_g1_i1.p1  ORF type:complete len:1365 (-),score=462.05 c12522_g1_i1:304-4398(-)
MSRVPYSQPLMLETTEHKPPAQTTQRIEVAVRIRPLHDMERENSSTIRVDSKRNEIVLGNQNKTFVFDWVAPSDTTQEEVFLRVGMPLANRCLEGYNGTAFAYGQTGSGKTFTMQGPCMVEDDFAVRGLIPRTLDFLFALIHKNRTMNANVQFQVMCSFYEIYNEEIFDLMQPSGSVPLTAREATDKGPFVMGLSEIEVSGFDEAYNVLLEGTGRRRVGSTQMNRESSRSHSVFTLYLTQHINDDGFVSHKHCKLNFVDLAGSERQRTSAAEGTQLKEASSINKSLSTLGLVIRGLVDQSAGSLAITHIPYRESKLTYLLRESFGGNSLTWMIANISPSRNSLSETLSTLSFAACASQVVTRATVNEDIAGSVDQLKDQIRSLQHLLDESEARVLALKEAQKRRRSARLSVQPSVLSPPPTPTPTHTHTHANANANTHAHTNTNVIRTLQTQHTNALVSDSHLKSIVSENSRIYRELRLARSQIQTLHASSKKKDELCQQYKFIARLTHAVMEVYRMRLTSQPDVNDEKINRLAVASQQCVHQLEKSNIVMGINLFAENAALRDQFENFDQDYKDWLVDNNDRLIRLQDSVAYLTSELAKTEEDNGSLREALKKWQTLNSAGSTQAPASHSPTAAVQQLAEKDQTIRELYEKVSMLEAEISTQDETIKELRHNAESTQNSPQNNQEAAWKSVNSALEAARDEEQRQRSRSEDMAKRLSEAQFQIQKLTSSLAEANAAAERSAQECGMHSELLASRDGECEVLQSRVCQLETQLHEATHDLLRQRTQNERIEQTLAQTDKHQSEIVRLNTELDTAKDMLDEVYLDLQQSEVKADGLIQSIREKDHVIAACMRDVKQLNERVAAGDRALEEARQLAAQLEALQQELTSTQEELRHVSDLKIVAQQCVTQQQVEYDTHLQALTQDNLRLTEEVSRTSDEIVKAKQQMLDRELYLSQVIDDLRRDLEELIDERCAVQAVVDALQEEKSDAVRDKHRLEDHVDNMQRMAEMVVSASLTDEITATEEEIQEKLLRLIGEWQSPTSNRDSSCLTTPSKSIATSVSTPVSDRKDASVASHVSNDVCTPVAAVRRIQFRSPLTAEFAKHIIATPLTRDLEREELRELRTFRDNALAEIDELSIRLDEATAELQRKDSKLRSLEEHVMGVEQQVTSLQTQLSAAHTTIHDLNDQLTVEISTSEEAATLQVEDTTTRLATITTLTAQLEAANTHKSELSDQVTRLQGEVERLNSAVTQLKTDRAVVEEECSRLAKSTGLSVSGIRSRNIATSGSQKKRVGLGERSSTDSPSKTGDDVALKNALFGSMLRMDEHVTNNRAQGVPGRRLPSRVNENDVAQSSDFELLDALGLSGSKI